MYLSQTDVPGQQQDEQQVLADLGEEDHQTPDRTVVPASCHQPETREARNIDDHVALGQVRRGDEVHSFLRRMDHRQEVLTSLCNVLEQLAVRQVQPVKSPRQQGEPEEGSSRSQPFRGEEVQVPGHQLVEHVADPLQPQPREPAVKQPLVLTLQPTHTLVVKVTDVNDRG